MYVYLLRYNGQHVSTRYGVIIRPTGAYVYVLVHEKNAYVMGSHSVYIRGSTYYWRGFACRDLRGKGKYIWVPFFDPEDIKILSLGAIWNFGKGTGLS
jgi:hypothetical protein